jgi:DnaJ-class molecular chaperone
MGHFVTTHNGIVDQHSDTHLRVRVNAEPGLRLEGMNVASNINISLLEALQGCKKTVNTILGEREVEIKPKSKNKDEVIIPHLGVNRVGCQRVILDIQYPDEVDGLIDFLSK